MIDYPKCLPTGYKPISNKTFKINKYFCLKILNVSLCVHWVKISWETCGFLGIGCMKFYLTIWDCLRIQFFFLLMEVSCGIFPVWSAIWTLSPQEAVQWKQNDRMSWAGLGKERKGKELCWVSIPTKILQAWSWNRDGGQSEDFAFLWTNGIYNFLSTFSFKILRTKKKNYVISFTYLNKNISVLKH